MLYVSPCYKGTVSFVSKTGKIEIRDVSKIKYETDGLLSALGIVKLYFGHIYGYEKPLMRLIALPSAEGFTVCSLKCNSRGSCNFLPHTNKMYCFCKDNFYGTNCEFSIEDQKMTNDLNKLIKVYRLHIPSNSDLMAELQKTESILRLKFHISLEKSKLLSKRISRITTNMVDGMNNRQKWQGLVIQYADVLQSLQYYYQVMREYDMSDINIEADPFLRNERLSFAESIINPDKLEKCLQMVNYLFTGRHDTPLLNHRSLIFEEMENNKADICSDRYKIILDNAYGSLSSLQLQGYATYIRAFRVLGVDSSKFVAEYEAKFISQKKYLDAATCNISIPNSRGLENCQGGYYVYSGMKIDVECKNAFYITGLYLIFA